MAHPFMFDSLELLEELCEAGKLDGIEVYHYSADGKEDILLKKCRQYGLIETGGSDFHGLYNEYPTYLGSRTTDEENLKRLFDMIEENKKK